MSADPTHPRWTVPRWVLEAWLWITVPAAVLEHSGCPGHSASVSCMVISNKVLAWLVYILPGEAFVPAVAFSGNTAVAIGVTVLIAGLCHLLVRRLLEARVKVWMLLLIYLMAGLLTYLMYGIAISVATGTPLLPLLREMAMPWR